MKDNVGYQAFIVHIPVEWHEDVDAIIDRYNVAVDLAVYLDVKVETAYEWLEREEGRPAARVTTGYGNG